MSELLATARTTFAAIGVSSLSSSEVKAAMKELSALRGAVQAFDGALRNRARELQPTPDPDPLPTPPEKETTTPPVPDSGVPEDVSPATLDEVSGVNTRTGQLRDRVARVLEQMPAMARALAVGQLAEAHIEELAKAMFSASDAVWAALIIEQDALVAAAGRMAPLEFGRFVSATMQRIAAQTEAPIERDLEAEIRGSMWIDSSTGMGKLMVTLSPRAFGQVQPLVRSTAARLVNRNPGMDKKQAIGQAILQLLTESAPEGSSGASITPHVAVLIDERTLFAGPHAATICEQPDGSRVPVDVARRLACEAMLIPVLHDSFGSVLDVGRAKRYNTPAQRIALMSMYATCFHSSCDVPITDCDGHHIVYWDDGGRTDMGNLLPVCQHHHRWIHANNPTITLDDRRVATVVMPNGTTTVHHPDRRPRGHDPGQVDTPSR